MASIAKIETVALDGADGPTHGILVAINTSWFWRTTTTVDELTKAILLQRMVSPPDTSVLLVSVIGSFKPEKFLATWQGAVAADPALSFFISQMTRASVIHGTSAGERLFEGSLLVPTRPP